MHKTLSVCAILLAGLPAYAQTGATQSPPTPNANNGGPTPPNSVPAGSTTMSPSQSPNPSPGITTSTSTGQQTSPVAPNTTPAAPSGSTGPTGNPSDAFGKTVPTPAR